MSNEVAVCVENERAKVVLCNSFAISELPIQNEEAPICQAANSLDVPDVWDKVNLGWS
jgi:hypothetical protein